MHLQRPLFFPEIQTITIGWVCLLLTFFHNNLLQNAGLQYDDITFNVLLCVEYVGETFYFWVHVTFPSYTKHNIAFSFMLNCCFSVYGFCEPYCKIKSFYGISFTKSHNIVKEGFCVHLNFSTQSGLLNKQMCTFSCNILYIHCTLWSSRCGMCFFAKPQYLWILPHSV